MDLNALADEVATVLGTISGLRVWAYPPGSVTPPAAIVSYPEKVDFDETYSRGMDRIPDWPVLVVVGKATDRTARTRIYQYAAATGSNSLKSVLQAHTWAACDVLTVTSVEFDVVMIGAVDYIAALFHLDITGQGTA